MLVCIITLYVSARYDQLWLQVKIFRNIVANTCQSLRLALACEWVIAIIGYARTEMGCSSHGFFGSWMFVNMPYLMPLREVLVVGDTQSLPKGLLKKALVKIDAMSYFSSDSAVVAKLENTGWIRSVKVKRQYPGRWWLFFTVPNLLCRL